MDKIVEINVPDREHALVALGELLDLARQDQGTSGARAARHLLMSLYNGRAWPFDMTHLHALDRRNKELALTVLAAYAMRVFAAEIHVAAYAEDEFEQWRNEFIAAKRD